MESFSGVFEKGYDDLKLKKKKHNDLKKNLCNKILDRELIKEEYFFICIGETKSGKTSFINMFMNYCEYGFQSRYYENKCVNENFIDNRRINTESNTKEIFNYSTVYANSKINMVDTPGLSSSLGYHDDEKTAKQLNKIFDTINHSKNNLDGILIFLNTRQNNQIPFINYILPSFKIFLTENLLTRTVIIHTNQPDSGLFYPIEIDMNITQIYFDNFLSWVFHYKELKLNKNIKLTRKEYKQKYLYYKNSINTYAGVVSKIFNTFEKNWIFMDNEQIKNEKKEEFGSNYLKEEQLYDYDLFIINKSHYNYQKLREVFEKISNFFENLMHETEKFNDLPMEKELEEIPIKIKNYIDDYLIKNPLVQLKDMKIYCSKCVKMINHNVLVTPVMEIENNIARIIQDQLIMTGDENHREYHRMIDNNHSKIHYSKMDNEIDFYHMKKNERTRVINNI